MNNSKEITERLFLIYLYSPMLGVLLIMTVPLAAVLFWLVFYFRTHKIKDKLARALKIGSFPIFFFLTMFVFALFGWFMHYATENGLHNSGGVAVFLLPYVLIVTIYTKVSDSYKKAIEILSET